MNLDTADFLPEKVQNSKVENWKKQDALSDNFYNWEDNGIWESQSDVLSKGKLKKLHNLHKFKTTAKSGTQPESSTTTGIKTTTTTFSEPSKKDNFLKYEESDNLKLSTDGNKKRVSYSEEQPMGINNGFFEDTIENTGQIFVGDVKKTTGSGKKVEIEYKTKVTASVEPQRAVPKPANLVHPGFTTKKDTVTTKTLKKLPSTKRVTPAVPAAELAKKHHGKFLIFALIGKRTFFHSLYLYISSLLLLHLFYFSYTFFLILIIGLKSCWMEYHPQSFRSSF